MPPERVSTPTIFFSCLQAGGWRKAHPLPSDKGRLGSFGFLFQENQQIVKDILDMDGPISIASLREPADQRLLMKLRNLYYSCMDESTLDQLGEGPLKDFVAQVKKLALFEFGVEGDAGFDPNFMTLWFQQPSLGLPSKVCTYSPIITLLLNKR